MARTQRRSTGRRPAVSRRAPARRGSASNLDFGAAFGALGSLFEQGFSELGALSSEQAREIVGVLLTLAGILGLVSLFPSHWPLLRAMSSIVRGLVGIGWVIVLPGMVYTGATMVLSRIWSRVPAPSGREVLCWSAVIASLLGLASLISLRSGGLVGLLVGHGGYSLLGPWVILPLIVFLIGLSVLALRMTVGQSLLSGISHMRGLYGQRSKRLDDLHRRFAGMADRLAPITARLRREAVVADEAPPPAPVPAAAGPAEPIETLTGEVIDPPATAGERLDSPAGNDDEKDDEPGTRTIARVVGDWDDMPTVDWLLPGLDLLDAAAAKTAARQNEIRNATGIIERTLQTFGVQARVTDVNSGPSVTQYAITLAAGVKVSRVVSLQNDLSLALGGVPLRIEAPIPGRAAVGIEVPNSKAATSTVAIREVAMTSAFQNSELLLGVVLGQDVTGMPVCGCLKRMPHLLLGGSTGQGKSTCVHCLLVSLLLQHTPDTLRLILVDPKRVELGAYKRLPHLACPVITEAWQAAGALKWGVEEMNRRYLLLEEAGVRDIDAYNERARRQHARELPRLVIVIDELADLMMVAAGEVEQHICRLTQLGRAAGLHLVAATQRPDSNVITGLIKANIPSRIAFAVGSQVDSRVILDSVGAEKLLGRGDMLYLPVDSGKPRRLQGAYISPEEVERVVQHWVAQGDPVYLGVLDGVVGPPTADGDEAGDDRKLDPLFARAARAVATDATASVSLVQRKFNCGYSRAGRIVDQLAQHGVVGPYQGSKARNVLMTLSDVDELLERLGLEG